MKKLNYIFLLILSAFIIGCGGSSDSTSSPEPSISLRVACVGDSITEGTGLSNPGQDSYPAQLAMMLGQDWEVQNFGKKSATLMKSGSLPYWNTSPFIPSHDFNPDVVVIMLGTNDAKSYNWANNAPFVPDYTELIQSYKNLPSAPIVYICYPPPVYVEVAGITDVRIRNEVIPKIAQVAAANGVEVIDIYNVLSNKKSLFSDGIHPNKEGARQLAEAVYQTIY
jgi:lysophospholipase L1-like esterase